MKKLKNPIESVTKATLILLEVQKREQGVPEWAIHNVCMICGLVAEEARKVRDIIQAKEHEGFWKKTVTKF